MILSLTAADLFAPDDSTLLAVVVKPGPEYALALRLASGAECFRLEGLTQKQLSDLRSSIDRIVPRKELPRASDL